jgi:hypothetical protein
VDARVERAEEQEQRSIEEVRHERQEQQRPGGAGAVETDAREQVAESVDGDRGAEPDGAAMRERQRATRQTMDVRQELVPLDADCEDHQRHGETSRQQWRYILLIKNC